MRTGSRVLAASVLVLLPAVAPLAAEEIDRVILRVNDQIATLSEYRDRRDARLAAIEEAGSLSVDDQRRLVEEAGRATLREIFEELLILSRAQQLHITASPADIDRSVDAARRRFGIATDADFTAALAQSGVTIEQFRQRMGRQILFGEVVQREVNPKVKVEDEEVARYWRSHQDEFAIPERRRVEEAVVRDDVGLSADAERELAVQLRDGMVGGEGVTALVERLAVGDRALALEHGWIARGELDEVLDTALWELGAGGVAGPVPGRGGLHVLHLLEIEPASVKPLEEVRDAIRQKLQDEQYEAKTREMLDSIERSAYIVEHLPPEAAGYRTAKVGDDDPVRALLRGVAATAGDATPDSGEPPTPSAPPSDGGD